MRIVTVIGARPQFIKAAPVSRALCQCEGVEDILVHTGQHFDELMSDVFFREMRIPAPKHNLGIGGLSHGAMTGRMLEAIERVLLVEKPDWVIVYGDTNSTLAGALAASKLKIPIAHVEAGLRSFNRGMPEEINRILTDRVSSLLLVPTELAAQNLLREGVKPDAIVLVGDVMYDAALMFGDIAERESRILNVLGVEPKSYILATIHRAENTDDLARLRIIFDALAEVSRTVPVVLPLHPRTRSVLPKAGIRDLQEIRVIEPIGFIDMVMLEMHALLVATDSGGVQKEAYFHRVPCVTLRDETEWVELTQLGVNTLVPPRDVNEIVRAIHAGLRTPSSAFLAETVYGAGDAAQQIVSQLFARHP